MSEIETSAAAKAAKQMADALEGCLHFDDGFVGHGIIGRALAEWREGARTALAAWRAAAAAAAAKEVGDG